MTGTALEFYFLQAVGGVVGVRRRGEGGRGGVCVGGRVEFYFLQAVLLGGVWWGCGGGRAGGGGGRPAGPEQQCTRVGGPKARRKNNTCGLGGRRPPEEQCTRAGGGPKARENGGRRPSVDHGVYPVVPGFTR